MLTAPVSRTRAARRPSDGALATLRRPLPETAASSATLRAVDGARPTLSYPRLLMNGNASRPAGASRTCLNLHWSPLWQPCFVLKNAQRSCMCAPLLVLAAPDSRANALDMSAGLDCIDLSSEVSAEFSNATGGAPGPGCAGPGGPGGPGSPGGPGGIGGMRR